MLQIPPETRLVYSKTTRLKVQPILLLFFFKVFLTFFYRFSAFKLTSSSIGFRPVVRAQVSRSWIDLSSSV